MQFISPQGEYPRFIGDIQLEHPNFKKTDPLPTGWVFVETVERPMPAQDEVVYEDYPIEIDGVMSQNWKSRPMTSEEIEFRDAPKRAKEKLIALGLTEAEVEALARGLVR